MPKKEAEPEIPPNFILTNRELASKFEIISNIRKTWASFAEPIKKKKCINTVIQNEEAELQKKLEKSKKWEKFKKDRVIIIDLYIELKRR